MVKLSDSGIIRLTRLRRRTRAPDCHAQRGGQGADDLLEPAQDEECVEQRHCIYLLIFFCQMFIYSIIDQYLQVLQVLRDADEDERVNVLVLTGSNDFFSSGQDLKVFFC